ncbi:MAG: hypothetical protein AVDCRST_MAG48-534, partial [uncultured Friedmanniella sp.]
AGGHLLGDLHGALVGDGAEEVRLEQRGGGHRPGEDQPGGDQDHRRPAEREAQHRQV